MLYTSLGYPENAFPAGIGWHIQIEQGFHQKAVWALAASLRLKAPEFAAYLGLKEPLLLENQDEVLCPRVSDKLFRIASAYQRLFIIFKDATPCLSWLKSPRRELNGVRPLELLMTTPGSAAVFDAIEKIKPPKKNEKPEVSHAEEGDEEPDDEVAGVDGRH